MSKPDLLQPADDDARAQSRALIDRATFAALGVIDPLTGGPHVTRIGVGVAPDGTPIALISDLAGHTGMLRSNPNCSLLVGEPGDKGNPLTYPRLTLTCVARFVARDSTDFTDLRAAYLARQPKAKLYVDFPDFHFVRFEVNEGFLNGGFGKAFRLLPKDLA